jgi:AcrR family transcriptional regulator
VAAEPVPARRIRERELVAATRALFDARGMQEAPIEEIAKAVGIPRGLVYRSFASKDELFVLTVTDYLDELSGQLSAAIAAGEDPTEQLRGCTESFASFCERYPAFLDSALSLMRRPATELRDAVSESVWQRLGRSMVACIGPLSDVLRAGRDAGRFTRVEDPDLTANVLWTHGLGVMHLARLQVGLRQAAPGVPELFGVRGAQIVETCVATALAIVGVT